MSQAEEYLTYQELADLLKIARRSAWKLKERGYLREGIHWTHPRGLGVRFKKSAILAWMEQGRQVAERKSYPPPAKNVFPIKMAKGYNLGG